ncbi:MAG: DUF1572 family protein [Saprospiraceae bacterium]
MHQNPFTYQFEADLLALILELELFPEERIWTSYDGFPNSAGILFRHLTGNLNHFFGHYIGHNGYQRDRVREFQNQGLPKKQMLEELEAAKSLTIEILEGMSPDLMDQPYTAVEFSHFSPTHLQALIKLSTHLSYHLGQIDAMRRVVGS